MTYRLGAIAASALALSACAAMEDKPAPAPAIRINEDPYPSTYQRYPGALTVVRHATVLDGARVHIWRAEVASTSDDHAENGTVVEARGDRFVIACGNGSRLRALELQIEGKRRMSARDFVNGSRTAVGARFA